MLIFEVTITENYFYEHTVDPDCVSYFVKQNSWLLQLTANISKRRNPNFPMPGKYFPK